MPAVDILVRTDDPDTLGRALHYLGAAIVATAVDDYASPEKCYVVRCSAGVEFVEFIIADRGYGKVLRRLKSPT